MQIIAKMDGFFVIFYSLLILLVGALLFFISGQALVLVLVPLLLAIYLKSALRKPWRRRQAAAVPLPAAWLDYVRSQSAYYRGLDEEGKKIFERDLSLFLSDDSVAAIGGAEVPWRTRLLIGAGVAAMLHGRPDWEPPLPDGVTVYPGMSFDRNYQVEKGNIAGQAPERGPLLITAGSLEEGFADPGDGRNVLIHELAHFFDREQRKISRRGGSWDVAWTREWNEHLRHGSILADYAALNEAEFFAVACEMFFENPGLLRASHPGLYAMLRDFFNQDPRQILGEG
jgi:MtfA peptidase